LDHREHRVQLVQLVTRLMPREVQRELWAQQVHSDLQVLLEHLECREYQERLVQWDSRE
jgi:hypothetical protein